VLDRTSGMWHWRRKREMAEEEERGTAACSRGGEGAMAAWR
jgi:hypothetical protein